MTLISWSTKTQFCCNADSTLCLGEWLARNELPRPCNADQTRVQRGARKRVRSKTGNLALPKPPNGSRPFNLDRGRLGSLSRLALKKRDRRVSNLCLCCVLLHELGRRLDPHSLEFLAELTWLERFHSGAVVSECFNSSDLVSRKLLPGPVSRWVGDGCHTGTRRTCYTRQLGSLGLPVYECLAITRVHVFASERHPFNEGFECDSLGPALEAKLSLN